MGFLGVRGAVLGRRGIAGQTGQNLNNTLLAVSTVGEVLAGFLKES